MKKSLSAVALLSTGLMLSGCGFGGFAASGKVTLQDGVTQSTLNDAAECTGYSGYDDIGGGTPVIISASGETVAKGELGPGKKALDGIWCEFKFSIEDVPGGSDFYSVEVAQRGDLEFTKEELESGVSLSLGG